jgi:hypothetical protein
MLLDPRMTARRPSPRPRKEREEGAVMLVVMLVVLMVTATAIFASHSTMFELRAAGSQRQAMQTQYVAEGSLTAALAMIDTLGAGSIDLAMQRVPIDAGRQFTPEEPAYGQSTPHFRAYMRDFLTMPGVIAPPVETTGYGGSFGTTLGYTPDFIIDINDSYDPGRPIAGMSATGDSPVAYRIWTITARGRTGLGAADSFAPAEPTAAHLRRGIHEAAMNSRALVISGPIAR